MGQSRNTGFLWGVLFLSMTLSTFAQTDVEPGFNLFSPQQDVEIGQQSAREVEQQLPMLRDQRVQNYVSAVGQRLAAVTPGPEFPYQFKVVNVSDVNAFALPGGFMYVNRGLIEAADSEGELAGVMAHEIAHVALRHGTNQASKAYLAQAGLGLLGALLGGGGSSTSQIVEAVGGFGLNATFLKFSRDAERQADVLGSQILARAGYDPMDMARFFEKLRQMQGSDPSGLETFFSSHPASADRAERVAQESRQLEIQKKPPIGDFSSIRSRLNRMAPAPSMKDLAEGRPPSSPGGSDQPVRVSIEKPSQRMKTFASADRLYRISYPENWSAHAGQGSSVTIVPEGGSVNWRGQEQIVYGVVINRFEANGSSRFSQPFSGRDTLSRAANELVANVLQNNSYLTVEKGSTKKGKVDGGTALLVRLTGPSPATNEQETVTLVARQSRGTEILYALFISPERDRRSLEDTFNRMLKSLNVS